MRKLCIAVLLSVLGWPSVVEAQQRVKIGYVDLLRALSECEAGKQAKAQFEAELERMERGLEQQRKTVEQLKDELEKKALLLREEERLALERDYRQSVRDFERRYNDAKEELEIKDKQLTSRILSELYQVVAAIGEQGQYTVILEGNNTVVLYGQKDIDLTDQVVAAYNQQHS